MSIIVGNGETVGPGVGTGVGPDVGTLVGVLVSKDMAVGSRLTLESDGTPASAAYDDIADASAPEETAVEIVSPTLPSTSASSYLVPRHIYMCAQMAVQFRQER
jgi:hypothetical protein